MKEKIKEIVASTAFEIIRENNKEFNGESPLLYTTNGLFDSMDLVNFISLLEERILNELKMNIQLTHSSIFSSVRSPFKTIDSTAEFILSLL
jgi:acyl carrier protein